MRSPRLRWRTGDAGTGPRRKSQPVATEDPYPFTSQQRWVGEIQPRPGRTPHKVKPEGHSVTSPEIEQDLPLIKQRKHPLIPDPDQRDANFNEDAPSGTTRGQNAMHDILEMDVIHKRL